MARSSDWEVIVPGKQSTAQPPQPVQQIGSMQQQPQGEQGFLSKVGGSLGRLGTSVAAGGAKVGSNALDLASALAQGQPQVGETGEITHPSLSPEMRQQYSITPKVEAVAQNVKEQFPAPIGFQGEGFLNQVAEATPGFLAAGGGLTNAVTRALGSETGQELVKQAGGGKLQEFFGGLVGSALVGGLLTGKNLGKIASQQYNTFEKSIPKGATAELTNAQSAYQNALGSSDLTGDASEWLNKNLKFIEPTLKAGSTGVKEAFDKMKRLNKLTRELVPSIREKLVREEVKQVFNNISTGLKKDIIASQEKYPSIFAQGLEDGASITWALNNRSLVSKALQIAGLGGVAASLGTGPGIAQFAGKVALGKASPYLVGGGIAAKGLLDPLLMSQGSPAAAKHVLGEQLPQTLSGLLLSR